jgi:hypothetical protein
VSVRTDLFFTLRELAAARGHTAIVVLTLARGLGASSAIFAVAHAVLLRAE